MQILDIQQLIIERQVIPGDVVYIIEWNLGKMITIPQTFSYCAKIKYNDVVEVVLGDFELENKLLNMGFSWT